MIQNSETKNMLWEIGLLLDRNQYPRIYNGGLVKPGDASIVSSIPGEESKHVNQRQRRSTARSRNGAARWQRASNRAWTTGTTAPFINPDIRKNYEEEIEAVQEAYPGTKVWQQETGLWLLTESTVLPGLGKKATFLTAIPYSENLVQKSWGFWTTTVSYEWIGPRHTNFPDGSMCAFDHKDGTWAIGDNIIKLLDLYTLWALRHAHLKVFGRWPGRQAVPYSYERVTELKDDEYCGCDNADHLYADCCKKYDRAKPLIKIFLDFMYHTKGHITRQPPPEILKFLDNRESPPPIKNLLT